MAKETVNEHLVGNDYHKLAARFKHPARKYDEPQDLLNDLVKYFEWLDENPLEEAKVFNGSDGLVHTELNKMRAPTLQSLCIFIGISRSTWGKWRRGEDAKNLQKVVDWAEDMMYARKFEGAAAGLLNANLIARDLKLEENVKSSSTVIIEEADSGL